MKVLFLNRSSFRNSVAGDSIQMLKTKQYIERLGVEADINCDPEQDFTKYDLVHLFNIMPVEEVYPLFRHAVEQKRKIVLSPIFWDPQEFLAQSPQIDNFAVWWEQTMPLRQEILNGVAMILPNAQLELEMLRKTFPLLPPATIIPNGVDPIFAQARPMRFIHRYQWTDFILSVGRICRRKNQVVLIKAAKALKLPLILIGPLNDSIYYQECRRESAGHKVLYIDCLKQDDLSSAYAAARVHALVSWYDTPGLVSLEAALAGCNIVSTERGSAKEYFGNLVEYCEPNDIESIKAALCNAWSKKKDYQLKNLVFEKFTWDKVAMETVKAYQQIV